MAYIQGDSILAAHFNGFVTDFNDDVWGVGNSDNGYGQSNTISTVAIGEVITATQWATLLSRINNAADHQTTSLTTITAPTSGEDIEALTALAGNITSVTSARLDIGSNISDTLNQTSGAAGWTTNTVHIFTETWGTGDEARYFFNCGGSIRIACSRSGGTAHTKNTEWANLCTAAGSIVFGAQGTTKVGGSGTTNILATTIGYHDLTGSYQTIFKQFEGTSPYTSNYIQIDVKSNGVQGANGDKGNIVTFQITHQDAAADDFDDTVDGTLQNSITKREPVATYLNNTSWTVPTYASTSFTQT